MSEIQPIICCERFREGYDQDDGFLRMGHYDNLTKTNLNKIHIRWMDSCYPECGPNMEYEPIDFCPFCGKKIEYISK